MGKPLLVDVTYKASCPVAALLDFASIGIENAVIEIGIRRLWRFDLQHLITADAEVTVCQRPTLPDCKVDRSTGCIQHHEVVPQSMHFGEF